MKRFRFVFICLLGCFYEAMAFTLVSSSPALFNSNEIKILIGNVGCSNLGLSSSELATKVQEAVDEYWNTIATSAVKLEVEGQTSWSNTASFQEIGQSYSVENQIVVGCSQNTADYPSGSTTLGLGSNAKTSSGAAVGLLTLNDTATTSLSDTTDQEFKAVIAHEIGHALGIGHSSVKHSLMYFSTGTIQEHLAEDDWSAMTYLYPHDSPGSCSATPLLLFGRKGDDNGKGGGGGPLSFVLGLFLSFLAYKLTPRMKENRISYR